MLSYVLPLFLAAAGVRLVRRDFSRLGWVIFFYAILTGGNVIALSRLSGLPSSDLRDARMAIAAGLTFIAGGTVWRRRVYPPAA